MAQKQSSHTVSSVLLRGLFWLVSLFRSVDTSLGEAKTAQLMLRKALTRMSKKAEQLSKDTTTDDTDILQLGENLKYLQDLAAEAWSIHANLVSGVSWLTHSSDVAVKLQTQELKRFATESLAQLKQIESDLEVIKTNAATHLKPL